MTEATSELEWLTDGLGVYYKKVATDSKTPAALKAAAELYAIVAGLIEKEHTDAAIEKATEVVSKFQVAQDPVGESDSLRLAVTAYRQKADSCRYGEGLAAEKAVRDMTRLADKLARDGVAKFKASGQKRSEAAALLAAAEVNYNKRGSKKREEALQFVQEALKLAVACGDTRLQASCIFVHGTIAFLMRKLPIAMSYFDEAGALYRQISDKMGEAKSLHMLGTVRFLRHEVDNSIQSMQAATAVWQQAGQTKMVAYERFMMSQFYIMQGRGKEALPLAEQALEIYRDLDYGFGWQARALDAVVQSYMLMGLDKKAARVAEDGVERFQKSTDRRGQVMALRTMANACLAKDDAEEAMRYTEEAQSVTQDIGDLKWEGVILQDIAQMHTIRDAFEQAKRASDEAVEIFQSLRDRMGEAVALSSLASLHMRKNDYSSAVQVASEQRAIFQELGHAEKEARSLLTIAACTANEEKLDDALSYSAEAQEMFQAAEDKTGEANALEIMAQVFQHKQDESSAIAKAKEMRETLRDLGDKVAEANACRVLANICMTFEKPSEAVRAASEALMLSKKSRSRLCMAEMLILVSQAHMSMVNQENPQSQAKGVEKALRPAKEALTVAKSLHNKALIGAAQYMIAQVQMFNLRLPEAMDAARIAIDLFRALDDKASECATVILIAEIHFMARRQDKALDAASEGLLMARSLGDGKAEWHAQQLIEKIEGPKNNQMTMEQMQQMMQQQGMPMQTAGATESSEAAAGAVSVAPKKAGLDPGEVTLVVQEMAKAAIGLDDAVYLDSPLMDSGMDSLTAVSFRNGLQQQLGVKLPSSMIFDYPTMKEVANRIVEISIEDE